MNRRGFLQSCLALAAAPAIVRADSLMRVVPRNTTILKPALYDLSGNGNHLYASVPTCLVFGVAHDKETQERIIDYLTGVLEKEPPEVRDAIFSYDQPITLNMPPVDTGVQLPGTATLYVKSAPVWEPSCLVMSGDTTRISGGFTVPSAWYHP